MENKVSEYDKEVYKNTKQCECFHWATSCQIWFGKSKITWYCTTSPCRCKTVFVKAHIFTADIDEKSGADYIIDICKNNEKVIPESTFDIIVCTEVLEHTLNPF